MAIPILKEIGIVMLECTYGTSIQDISENQEELHQQITADRKGWGNKQWKSITRHYSHSMRKDFKGVKDRKPNWQ